MPETPLFKNLFVIPVKNDYHALKRCLENISKSLNRKEEALVAVGINGDKTPENEKAIEMVKKFTGINIRLLDYTLKDLPEAIHKTNQHLGEIRTRIVKDCLSLLDPSAVVYIIDCDCLLSPNYLEIGDTLRNSDNHIGISKIKYIQPFDDVHFQKISSAQIRKDFEKLGKTMTDSENSVRNGLKSAGSKFWCCRHRAFQINFKLSWFLENQLLLDPGPHMMNLWTKAGAKTIACDEQVISSEFRDSDRVTNGIGNDVQNSLNNVFVAPKKENAEALKRLIDEKLITDDFSSHMEILMGAKTEDQVRNNIGKTFTKVYNILVNNQYDRLVEVIRELSQPGPQYHKTTLFNIIVSGGLSPDNEKTSSIEKMMQGFFVARFDYRQSLLSGHEMRAKALTHAREKFLHDKAVIMEVHL